MFGIIFLLLAAGGILLTPEGRSNPVMVGFAILVLVGTAGLIYGRWLDIRSKQAMIDLERRNRR